MPQAFAQIVQAGSFFLLASNATAIWSVEAPFAFEENGQ